MPQYVLELTGHYFPSCCSRKICHRFRRRSNSSWTRTPFDVLFLVGSLAPRESCQSQRCFAVCPCQSQDYHVSLNPPWAATNPSRIGFMVVSSISSRDSRWLGLSSMHTSTLYSLATLSSIARHISSSVTGLPLVRSHGSICPGAGGTLLGVHRLPILVLNSRFNLHCSFTPLAR